MRRHGVVLLVTALLAAAPARGQTTEQEIQRGIDLLQRGKQEEASQVLEGALVDVEDLLREHPDDARTWHLKGSALMYLARDPEALEAFNQAVSLEPSNARHYVMRGQLERAMRKPGAAVESLRKATELAPKDPDCWKALAGAYLDQTKHEASLECLERAMALAPEDAALACYAAEVRHASGDVDGAIRMYRRAVKLDPDHVGALYNLGLMCQIRGRAGEALTWFRRVVAVDPDDWRAWSRIVQCAESLGDRAGRDEARATVFALHRKGLVLAPDFCRDQFTAGGRRVFAYEHFALEGEWAVRYTFQVADESGRRVDYRISLGSYAETNAVAREQGLIGPGENQFHLDSYHADGEHRTYAFFKGEPAYEETKRMAVEVVEQTRKAISCTKPAAEGTEIRLDPGE